ncbi:DNA methyltransferase [Thermomonas paludicola]|uniref:DNA methyltransferase n=1 Tax=Thermomonas paludicola TaxID=2884874 RepID=UPI002113CA8B|nr:DNA methyltransferase [Thermomonas paludicola]
MPLSLNEIRERARAFAKEWAGETSERAEAQSFWNDFFNVFGVKRRSVAIYEQKAKRFSGSQHGRIDVFWPRVMLAEHKSAGVDLDAAYEQATDYFAGLTENERPQYILVSDFRSFRLYDLEGDTMPVAFALAELHKQIGRFGFISGYQTRSYKEEDPVNVQAAERMGRLHDALKAAGYDGHALELLLVRLLFCLFADDTGIFPRQSFHELIAQRTSEDGADLGLWVGRIFQVLNTPPEKRQTTLDEQLAELPYVNGRLFEEVLPLADFNAQMRGLLLDASLLDWSRISPAIFGSMFQSVMDAKARRNLGAHYTSEKNILKLIGPLFLDGLKAELDKAGNDTRKLAQLHSKLATLTFLDPACGCGNFLVIAYRELRALELEVLTRQFATQQSVLAHVQDHVLVDVDQFHGIEIEEFPAQIAQVAMWLMDHQMNLRVSEQFGENVVRLPLKKSATIVHGNALRIDWNAVVPAEKLHYILGNPPFIGHQWRNAEQMADMERIWGNDGRFGRLDYVTAWYRLATDYMRTALDRHSREGGNPALENKRQNQTLDPRLRGDDGIKAAFVSTNSICQGEQVGILWGNLLARGVHLHFGHRTFQWTNEARANAAVHCVIVGFGLHDVPEKWVFEYETPKSEALAIRVDNVNPYLVGGPNVLLPSRTKPQPGMPEMCKGSQPTDGGHLILTDDEKRVLLAEESAAEKFIRRYIGGDELINGGVRWCLWLKHASPSELAALPKVRERVAKVRDARLKSPTKQVRDYAEMPTLFTQDRQPESTFMALSEVSSESRRYMPVGFFKSDVVPANTVQIVVGATVFHFGIISSRMHSAWTGVVAGRLESRIRYTPSVYNNFPWPEPLDDKARAAIEAAAQTVLDARAQFPDATLADLYDPLTMPPALVKAHAALDKAVDAAYLAAEKAAARKPPRLDTDAERVAFLFQRYQALTSLLPATIRPLTSSGSSARNRLPG